MHLFTNITSSYLHRPYHAHDCCAYACALRLRRVPAALHLSVIMHDGSLLCILTKRQARVLLHRSKCTFTLAASSTHPAALAERSKAFTSSSGWRSGHMFTSQTDMAAPAMICHIQHFSAVPSTSLIMGLAITSLHIARMTLMAQ